MKNISCVGLIPAEPIADPATGLNVLVMAINAGAQPQNSVIRLFGSLEGDLKVLTEKEYTLAPGEHAHLYFHIPAGCFAPAFWDGTEPEEMTVFAGTDSPETAGKLVFIEL